MHRGVACCVVSLLVVLSVAAPATGATPDQAFGMPQEFDPDSVSLSAALQPDGDAAWQFTYRMRLTTDNETAAFEELQRDVRQNRSAYVDRFRERIRGTVAAAENATERNMSVANVSVSTRVNSLNEYSLGVVTYSFTWHGFAAVDGERIVAGDALEGFYLDNETSLTISWPENYEALEVDPPGERPRANAVKWSGPIEFGVGQPSVVVAPADTTTTDGGPTTVDLTDTNGGPTEPSGGGTSLWMLVGALLVVLVAAAAGWLYWTRSRDGEPPGPVPSPPGGGGTGGESGGGESGGSGGGEAAESGAAGGAAAGAASEEPPEELLSNEERVKRFLESQGGRAKQQAVVEELGWTEAKTSQVVKEMRENDELESFRIGRENVLKLPEADDLRE
ncbi:MAG: helix-turn-helix transcriptional regulator [Halobacterium sp.]